MEGSHHKPTWRLKELGDWSWNLIILIKDANRNANFLRKKYAMCPLSSGHCANKIHKCNLNRKILAAYHEHELIDIFKRLTSF